MERERFGKNLAAMTSGTPHRNDVTQGANPRELEDVDILPGDKAAQKVVATSAKGNPRAALWAALRNHITQSMGA